jgi:hypothetical protein
MSTCTFFGGNWVKTAATVTPVHSRPIVCSRRGAILAITASSFTLERIDGFWLTFG